MQTKFKFLIGLAVTSIVIASPNFAFAGEELLRLPLSACVIEMQTSAETAEWMISQSKIATVKMLAAISPAGAAPGSVMASPSKVHPNYFYHWVRDGALTIGELEKLALKAAKQGSPEVTAQYHALVEQYIELSRNEQKTPNWSTKLQTGTLGEPKFEMSGDIFAEGWGRPQNDGPALRTLPIIQYANYLIENGRKAEVIEKLYNPAWTNGTLIKNDLEFVAKYWNEHGFDPWEEIDGHHFYTRMVQLKSLTEGSKFARALGDTAAAEYYASVAKLIKNSLNDFYSADKKYILATVNPAYDGGKDSQLDIQVLLAVLHAEDADYSVTNDRVLATVRALETKFQEIYTINQVTKTPAGNVMAPATGRYSEDTYNGYTNKGIGNPWYLSTLAMAEFQFRFASAIEKSGSFTVSELNQDFVKGLNLTASVSAGTVLKKGTPGFNEVVAASIEKGNQYIRRVQYHAGHDWTFSEQFNRETGYPEGATFLTWTTVAQLQALDAQSEALHLQSISLK